MCTSATPDGGRGKGSRDDTIRTLAVEVLIIMNLERALLIGFVSIYFAIDVSPLLALPASAWGHTALNALALTFDAIFIALLAYWYLRALPGESALREGMVLSAIGVGMWIGSVFLNEVSSAIIQGAGIVSGISKAVEDFGSMGRMIFLNPAVWLIPTTLVAFYLRRGKRAT